ncbi:MAG: hypothetical protein WEA61_01635 [Anaerolineales bacterium]
MKSLSILVLLGSVVALALGGFLAVIPVFADNSNTQAVSAVSQPASGPLAPITGDLETQIEITPIESRPAFSAPVAEVAAADPGSALASTFTVSLTKDRAAMEAMLVAEAEASEAAVQFDDFVAAVSNGEASQLAGIYVDGVLANAVTRQPSGNAAYVSPDENEVTLFGLAAQYGSQAFLAHNYLAGARFSELTAGQIVTLVYGDGSTEQFRISEVLRYQALSPDSTQSRFIDLETGKELSASSLFHTIYNSDHAVVLQTCIANEGISTWGRLFVIAEPVVDQVASNN